MHCALLLAPLAVAAVLGSSEDTSRVRSAGGGGPRFIDWMGGPLCDVRTLFAIRRANTMLVQRCMASPTPPSKTTSPRRRLHVRFDPLCPRGVSSMDVVDRMAPRANHAITNQWLETLPYAAASAGVGVSIRWGAALPPILHASCPTQAYSRSMWAGIEESVRKETGWSLGTTGRRQEWSQGIRSACLSRLLQSTAQSALESAKGCGSGRAGLLVPSAAAFLPSCRSPLSSLYAANGELRGGLSLRKGPPSS